MIKASNNKLKQQISKYLKKTQYRKTLERIKKKRPCHKDGAFFFVLHINFYPNVNIISFVHFS